MTYKESPHYIGATEQEKKWFDHFYESRDILTATKHAFRVSTDESARTYGKSVLAREHITALFSEFCAPKPVLPSAEDLKYLYIDIANNANATPRDKLAALMAYERLSGFTIKGKPTAPQIEDDPFAGIDE